MPQRELEIEEQATQIGE